MAATWIWVLVYVVGFVLFQVLLYRYLQRGETTLEQPTPDYGDGDGDGEHRHVPRSAGEDDAVGHRTPSVDDPYSPDEDGVRCRHCGAYNESTGIYTYCRQCTEPLSGTAR